MLSSSLKRGPHWAYITGGWEGRKERLWCSARHTVGTLPGGGPSLLTLPLTLGAGDGCAPWPPPPPGKLPAPAGPSTAPSKLRPHYPAPFSLQFWMLILATTIPMPAGYFMPIFIFGESGCRGSERLRVPGQGRGCSSTCLPSMVLILVPRWGGLWEAGQPGPHPHTKPVARSCHWAPLRRGPFCGLPRGHRGRRSHQPHHAWGVRTGR